MLVLLTFFIVIACLILFSSGCEVFAVVLLFCEIHVIFLIYCLSLSWVRFDTQINTILSNQNRYIALSTVAVALVVVTLFIFVDVFNNSSNFSSTPSFTITTQLLVYNLVAGSTVTAQYISSIILILHAFEFLVVNFFMFLAIILYVILQKTISIVNSKGVCSEACGKQSNAVINGYLLRAQKQCVQLNRSTATAMFIKNTKKWRGTRKFFYFKKATL